ncbi:DUF192 domain-containing protein [Acetobacteraceae bacterium ESL0709]|nr:DUF192 domain-containing protein [Acetobacteraceae bacterium ESL0697]MDF7677206.1 DUF192 domain-containing protein [Acetobacteraceae bacterium ESL0709]
MFVPAYGEDDIAQAQPELPTVPLAIITKDGVRHDFTVELAKTEKQQEIGEMFRKAIPARHGMLFLWKSPQESDMWMRNTYVSLDMVFIDADHHVHAIAENTVPLSEAVISSHGAVSSVLELPAGTTEKLGIVVGDRVESPGILVKAGSKG